MFRQSALSVFVVTLLLIGSVFLFAAPVTYSQSNGNGNGNGANKIRICHSTDSHSNPYTNPEVDQDAIDGDLGNDKGQGDHYMEHNGPVWYDGIADHSWGDIIPPIEGVHGGKNWDANGQAWWNNGCNNPAQQPSPTPSATPSASPEVSPSPTSNPSPTPSSNPQPGRQSALGVDIRTCDMSEFEVTFDLFNNGQPVEGVVVTFSYNPTMTATTNAQGRARVFMPKLGDGTVTATADGYPTQTIAVAFQKDCPAGQGGAVQGASTSSQSSGQVLGATTLADTGSADEQLALMAILAGVVTTGVALSRYAKVK